MHLVFPQRGLIKRVLLSNPSHSPKITRWKIKNLKIFVAKFLSGYMGSWLRRGALKYGKLHHYAETIDHLRHNAKKSTNYARDIRTVDPISNSGFALRAESSILLKTKYPFNPVSCRYLSRNTFRLHMLIKIKYKDKLQYPTISWFIPPDVWFVALWCTRDTWYMHKHYPFLEVWLEIRSS